MAPIDWQALRDAFAQLRSEHFQLGDCEALLARLEELCAPLREFSAFEELYGSTEHRGLLADSAHQLTAWEERGHVTVLQASDVSTEVLEQWNALWVRSRDLAWTLSRDILGTQDRVRRLLPDEFLSRDKARFEAWKLAAVLENIGRLEVRGRDSLGMSVLVTFSASTYAEFSRWLEENRLQQRWNDRRAVADFVDSAILCDEAALTVVFTFKVAQEVGALGDNVARLAEAMAADRIFWGACSVEAAATNVFAHTRWASNGIISEPNCHPINNETFSRNGGAARPSGPWITAALNGDVDNYQHLLSGLQQETAITISPRITTDTKIIPVMVAHHLKNSGGDLRKAFCQAVSQFEGSVAIVMHSTSDPHRTYLALRGSGQALFVGIAPHGYVFASELYGVVEHTSRFLRMDGAGQVLVLDDRKLDGLRGIEAYSFDGTPQQLEESTVKTAEITTRDINRGSYEHFLLKEISESPLSVQKTLQGKFFLEADKGARMNLGEKVFPKAVAERLRGGQIRRVYWIGQGTAAIAGAAVASMMERALAGSPITVSAIKASELSGYSMHDGMEDCIVIAISQSGTTTDTNRTVDMARERGAAAIAIVNRRNSDLTYKVDGVLYTSDGRDIEMSVASTKAFYSQVVAGYLIALHMALILKTMSTDQVRQELEELMRLPDKMGSVLEHQEVVRNLAERVATTRRDWAVVGSGSTRASADEVRIKLSELCYKSIATDYIEDKKHIDLSSEPLTLVCAAGLPLMALRDAVKEVAIFKSHKSVPIVICSEGFDDFERYASGVIYVPRASENASVLLNTLVGHLWGYYCARAIDRGAAQLRPARALAVQHLSDNLEDSPSVFNQVVAIGRNFQADLARGLFNSSLSVDTGALLSSLFQYFTGARSLHQFSLDFQMQGNVAETLISTLSRAIHELARPIDAIKHQAKTVTVGISRMEEALEGMVFDALRHLEAPLESIPYRDLATLRAITPAVSQVTGTTLYNVSGLSSLGETRPDSQVKVVKKSGLSQQMVSRADHAHALLGTKEWVVRTRRSYIGLGRKDQRPIVIVPILPSGQVEGLALLHLQFHDALTVEQKVTVLRDMHHRYDDLKGQVTETDLEWQDSFLEILSVVDLIMLPVDKLAEQIIVRFGKPVGAARG